MTGVWCAHRSTRNITSNRSLPYPGIPPTNQALGSGANRNIGEWSGPPRRGTVGVTTNRGHHKHHHLSIYASTPQRTIIYGTTSLGFTAPLGSHHTRFFPEDKPILNKQHRPAQHASIIENPKAAKKKNIMSPQNHTKSPNAKSTHLNNKLPYHPTP